MSSVLAAELFQKLGKNTKDVWIAHCRYRSSKAAYFVSRARIAEDTGLTRVQVEKANRRLIAAGLMVYEGTYTGKSKDRMLRRVVRAPKFDWGNVRVPDETIEWMKLPNRGGPRGGAKWMRNQDVQALYRAARSTRRALVPPHPLDVLRKAAMTAVPEWARVTKTGHKAALNTTVKTARASQSKRREPHSQNGASPRSQNGAQISRDLTLGSNPLSFSEEKERRETSSRSAPSAPSAPGEGVLRMITEAHPERILKARPWMFSYPSWERDLSAVSEAGTADPPVGVPDDIHEALARNGRLEGMPPQYLSGVLDPVYYPAPPKIAPESTDEDVAQAIAQIYSREVRVRYGRRWPTPKQLLAGKHREMLLEAARAMREHEVRPVLWVQWRCDHWDERAGGRKTGPSLIEVISPNLIEKHHGWYRGEAEIEVTRYPIRSAAREELYGRLTGLWGRTKMLWPLSVAQRKALVENWMPEGLYDRLIERARQECANERARLVVLAQRGEYIW